MSKNKNSINTRSQTRNRDYVDQETQFELDMKYPHPPTKNYRRHRAILFACLTLGIISTAFAIIGRSLHIDQLPSFYLLMISFAFLGIAIYMELMVIRKERRAYQQLMLKQEKKVAKKAKKGTDKK